MSVVDPFGRTRQKCRSPGAAVKHRLVGRPGCRGARPEFASLPAYAGSRNLTNPYPQSGSAQDNPPSPSAKGDTDANGLEARQRLHEDMVSVREDRVRQALRRDAVEIPEGRFWPDGADLAPHGPHTTRSLPTRDPEDPPCLHPLRDRHARHGLV